jgi:hypothetical protein
VPRDWTSLIGTVEVGLKAANSLFQGQISGPVCPACDLSMVITPEAGLNPLVTVDIHHNRPPTVNTAVTFTVLDSSGARVRRWRSSPQMFSFGSHVQVVSRVPGPILPAGTYTLSIGLNGMGRWSGRGTTFEQQ